MVARNGIEVPFLTTLLPAVCFDVGVVDQLHDIKVLTLSLTI
jgi:hypothetical protein